MLTDTQGFQDTPRKIAEFDQAANSDFLCALHSSMGTMGEKA